MEAQTINTGIIFNEEISRYHSTDAVSHSKLCDLVNPEPYGPRYNPSYYHGRYISKTIKGPAIGGVDFGHAAHALILEGEKTLAERFAVSPFDSFRSNESKDWKVAQEKRGLIILTQKDADETTGRIRRIAEAIENHPDARILLDRKNGRQEVTFRMAFAKYAIQCRADQWIEKPGLVITGNDPVNPSEPRVLARTIVDLKSCESIERFCAAWPRLRYHTNAAFYREVECMVYAHHIGESTEKVGAADYIFVVVETNEPYRVMIYEIDEQTLAAAQREVVKDLRFLKERYEKNDWLAPIVGVQKLALNEWAMKRSTEATFEV